jgi:hypothetical protein
MGAVARTYVVGAYVILAFGMINGNRRVSFFKNL